MSVEAGTTERLAPARVRRIALLVNPAAGRHDPWAIARLAGFLARDGAEVETITSRGPGDLATRVADLDVDTVAVAGGDGTVNEVVAALVRRPEPRPRLVVVPQGTANVLAHEHRLPRRATEIADAVAAGKTRTIRLGSAATPAGEKPFFLMVSAGLDAEVVAAVEKRRFRGSKKLAFVVSALRLAFARRPRIAVEVWVPGESEPRRFGCALAIVAKAMHYGGPFVLTRATASDRPGLVFVGLVDDRPATLIRAVVAIARGRLETSGAAVTLPAARVRLEPAAGDSGGAVQIDGEPAGTTPIDVAPSDVALELIVAD